MPPIECDCIFQVGEENQEEIVQLYEQTYGREWPFGLMGAANKVLQFGSAPVEGRRVYLTKFVKSLVAKIVAVEYDVATAGVETRVFIEEDDLNAPRDDVVKLFEEMRKDGWI